MNNNLPIRINKNLSRNESELLIELDLISKGLFPYSDDKQSEFPLHLRRFCGRGIGIWQYPVQFSKYLRFLLDLEIKSYLEIGVAAGGTFRYLTDFLNLNSTLLLSHALDIAPPGETYRGGPNMYTESFKEWLDNSRIGCFSQLNTPSEEILLNNYDLIMIDGDHSYDGVKKDYVRWGSKSKILVFHDITNDKTPGVKNFWAELKSENANTAEFIEFTQQYQDVDGSFLGIGIMLKR